MKTLSLRIFLLLGLGFGLFTATNGYSNSISTKDIELYLQNLRSYQADFQQYTAGYPLSEGTFSLLRPGRFLWRYETPNPQRIIANGSAIYFIDDISEQVTQLPRSGSLAKLLFEDNVQLESANTSVRQISQNDQFVEVKLDVIGDQLSDGALESISLFFARAPLQLRRIISTDKLGNEVDVVFQNIRENETISKKRFNYTPPHYETNF